MHTYRPLEEENLHIYGRTSRQNPLPLFWTASGIEFETDASLVYLDLETDFDVYEQWIRVEVNGYSMIRMPLPKGRSKVSVFQGMQKDSRKRVRVYKEVQAMSADNRTRLLVHGVICDGKLYPLPKKSCRLEFVGDSITSGEGLAGNDAIHDWVSMLFSTKDNYAVQTAERLQADYRILSQSGWGAYSSWENDPLKAIPLYYEQVCGVLQGENNERLGAYEKNDFTAWNSDVTIVNLGCNDGSAFENPAWTDEKTGLTYRQKKNPDGTYEEASISRFQHAVYEFLRKIRRCNPNTYILWAYGMIGRPLQPFIETAINAYKKDFQDEKCKFLLLPDLKPEWMGANCHPGTPSHTAAADVLTKEIRRILSEEKVLCEC
ncbi:MAG: GDSL family lipase [Lachnospiraceae bacterium]|nr:GDSL family lipase [Lachnospiraceae bacterium]